MDSFFTFPWSSRSKPERSLTTRLRRGFSGVSSLAGAPGFLGGVSRCGAAGSGPRARTSRPRGSQRLFMRGLRNGDDAQYTSAKSGTHYPKSREVETVGLRVYAWRPE